jgi:NADPH-dependent 2,4-dienoyl-CoA reductase/sulfur reductase-like enzyme
MADETMRLHWEARNAQIKGRPAALNVDLEIIQERHHAINWVIGYDALDWDEVTTDT